LRAVSPDALELRRRIFESFAATGAPPVLEDEAALPELVAAHVVVLGGDGQVRMAHPFAGHADATRVVAGGRVWWGNCAWDGLGIAAALGLHDATVTSNGISVEVEAGEPIGDAMFHIAVPARHWWDDIGFT
jgi:hypothetical protein